MAISINFVDFKIERKIYFKFQLTMTINFMKLLNYKYICSLNELFYDNVHLDSRLLLI